MSDVIDPDYVRGLEAKVAEYEAIEDLSRRFGLGAIERAALVELWRARPEGIRHGELMRRIYAGRGNPPERRTTHMTAHRLRTKLKGSGYRVPEYDKQAGYRIEVDE